MKWHASEYYREHKPRERDSTLMPSQGECISTSNSQDPCSASSLAELFCTKNYDRITPTRMCSLAPQ